MMSHPALTRKGGIDKGKYGPMEETHGYLDQHWHVQAGLEGNPEGEWQKSDWTVKVDANAVFKPEKLISRIHLMPIPQKGGFLVNCEKVKYGFFGNLENFDKTAFSVLVANIDYFYKTTVSNWKAGTDKGKYGPMEEDLFAEMCMRKNGATAMEAFD